MSADAALWLALVAVSAALVAGALDFWPQHIGPVTPFYEARAQIIPVLLLVLAVEVRLLRPGAPAVDLRIACLGLGPLGTGEFYALPSVDRGSRGGGAGRQPGSESRRVRTGGGRASRRSPAPGSQSVGSAFSSRDRAERSLSSG